MRVSILIALLPLTLALPTKRQLNNLLGGATGTGTGTSTGGADLLSGLTGGGAAPAAGGKAAGGATGAGGLVSFYLLFAFFVTCLD